MKMECLNILEMLKLQYWLFVNEFEHTEEHNLHIEQNTVSGPVYGPAPKIS